MSTITPITKRLLACMIVDKTRCSEDRQAVDFIEQFLQDIPIEYLKPIYVQLVKELYETSSTIFLQNDSEKHPQ